MESDGKPSVNVMIQIVPVKRAAIAYCLLLFADHFPHLFAVPGVIIFIGTEVVIILQ
jgi:3-hydroxymyristoyl/3-hydroxydecanoyl-(acyl carrier protein) dehydratase